MNTFVLVLLGVVCAYLLLYALFFFVFRAKLMREEQRILDIFLSKTAKIPALIEVMRPYVFDAGAFDAITSLHSQSMIRRFDSIYDLLEQNARIHNEFLFLMKLSMHIPSLQKDEYFLYIRDFVIGYERDLHTRFSDFNRQVTLWNKFVFVKNASLIGYVLPGKHKMTIGV